MGGLPPVPEVLAVGFRMPDVDVSAATALAPLPHVQVLHAAQQLNALPWVLMVHGVQAGVKGQPRHPVEPQRLQLEVLKAVLPQAMHGVGHDGHVQRDVQVVEVLHGLAVEEPPHPLAVLVVGLGDILKLLLQRQLGGSELGPVSEPAERPDALALHA